MNKHIVIIGAGAIGAAIGRLLKKSGVHVDFWDKIPGKVSRQKPLEDLLPLADVVFVCVPSRFMRPALLSLKPFLKKKTAVVSLTKGIEEGSNKTMAMLLHDLLPRGQKFGLLAGPLLAQELNSGQGGVAVVASPSKEVFKLVHNLFSGSAVRVEYVAQIYTVGVLIVMKNIYAIAVGIACGLRWGDNRKGFLMAKAAQEMNTILDWLQLDSSVLLSSAGLGDFFATASSPYSSNHQYGICLATKQIAEKESEGCVSFRQFLQMVGPRYKKCELLTVLKSILVDKKSARAGFKKFFT